MSNFDVPPDSLPISERASVATFSESGVTVTTQKGAEVSSQTIQLGIDAAVSRTADDGTYSATAQHGIEITPNRDLVGVDVDVSSNTSGVTTAYLTDTAGTVLDSTSISSGSARLLASLTAGTAYFVVMDDGGNSYTAGRYQTETFPVSGDALDITAGVFDMSSGSEEFNVNNVEGIESTGSAIVEPGKPDQVFRYDAATYEAAEDGETVTVDVEESTDGGSTWTTIATDIQRGQDISNADPDGEVRLVVNVSRTSVANNPRAESVAYRWVL